MLATVLLVSGFSFGLCTQLPQLLRTVVRRQTAGLSALGVRMGMTANGLWMGYGVAAHDGAQLGCNALLVTFGVLTARAHRRHSGAPVPRRLDLGVLVLWALWAAAALSAQADLLARTGAVLGLLVGLPQLLRLVRTPDAAGVAPGTYLLSLGAGTCWAAYWLVVGRPLVAASAGYCALLALTGLVLLLGRPRVAARRELVLAA
ncbi:uncharacterized protein with PQ loop repeat [Motilibacter rhizosphaerae]|uniref:Uncharacterized protein with PQ loop repeat n=1 Tax=Motilibacter rhizosphaerae TaxID=598652 RepID=A0A4Q7NSC5_9ACTN|nr:PQ-loop domain-containing transporter [Motilibacter rhizosphaerae]RZS89997.1 uncharacterized protein with PQ loop repeat [Motilibacter rhizosphaerae]